MFTIRHSKNKHRWRQNLSSNSDTSYTAMDPFIQPGCIIPLEFWNPGYVYSVITWNCSISSNKKGIGVLKAMNSLTGFTGKYTEPQEDVNQILALITICTCHFYSIHKIERTLHWLALVTSCGQGAVLWLKALPEAHSQKAVPKRCSADKNKRLEKESLKFYTKSPLLEQCFGTKSELSIYFSFLEKVYLKVLKHT